MRAAIFFLALMMAEAWAAQAVVRVARAPLFQTPSLQASVVQWIEKGEVIFIAMKPDAGASAEATMGGRWESEDGDWEEILQTELQIDLQGGEKSIPQRPNPAVTAPVDFFITYDRLGRKAYIPRSYVTPFYADARDLAAPAPTLDPDPTLRAQGDLPENYPFVSPETLQGQALLGTGTQNETNYPYPRKLESEEFGFPLTAQLALFRSAKFLPNRLRFGGMLRLGLANHLFLQSGAAKRSKEQHLSAHLGPFFVYDFALLGQTTLGAQGGPFFSWHQAGITSVSESETELRTYTGFSIGASVSLFARFPAWIPGVRPLAQVGLTAVAPHTLRSSEPAAGQGLWQRRGPDEYRLPFTVNASALVGLSTSF